MDVRCNKRTLFNDKSKTCRFVYLHVVSTYLTYKGVVKEKKERKKRNNIDYNDYVRSSSSFFYYILLLLFILSASELREYFAFQRCQYYLALPFLSSILSSSSSCFIISDGQKRVLYYFILFKIYLQFQRHSTIYYY